MAEQRKIKRKAKKQKSTTVRRRRIERRFLPRATPTTWALFAVGMLGALALGAGVFGYWVKDPPIEYSVYLVVAGALGLAAALWFSDLSGVPVRVGDAGVALEKGTDLVRVAWCDIESVTLERGQLLIKDDGATLAIPVAAHPQATAWILSEGIKRLPDIIQVKRRQIKELPEPEESAGEKLKIESLQVAGRRCRESDTLISFERDARVCPNCSEVYHRLHVPNTCSTCDRPLGSHALTA